MSDPFDPNGPRVDVIGYLAGPIRTVRVRFALDTGASFTCIRPSVLEFAGYEIQNTSDRKRMTAVTGIVEVPVIPVNGLFALNVDRTPFRVVAYELAAHTIDGLLGLDFLRDYSLTLDFSRGHISLRPPHPRWQFWR